jgi:hypothetical protein
MAQSIVPSGYFGTGSENIHIIENFIDTDICDEIQKFLTNDEIWKISKETTKEKNDFWVDKVLPSKFFNKEKFYPYLVKKMNELEQKICDTFNVSLKYPEKRVFFTVVRWVDGSEQDPHGDKENEDGSPQRFDSILDYDISTIIYLNDNYDRGELYFPQHDISIKPTKGMVVMFPGDRYYIHGVSKIENGTRFTIPRFWTVDKLI